MYNRDDFAVVVVVVGGEASVFTLGFGLLFRCYECGIRLREKRAMSGSLCWPFSCYCFILFARFWFSLREGKT